MVLISVFKEMARVTFILYFSLFCFFVNRNAIPELPFAEINSPSVRRRMAFTHSGVGSTVRGIIGL